MKSKLVALVSVAAIAAALMSAPAAHGAPTLAQISAQVRALEEEATAAAEGAQEAKVKLAALQRSLTGIQSQAEIQGRQVSAISRSLGIIAVNQYNSGSLGQGMELLFSSDPSLYLSSAGSLEAITRQKSVSLRKFQSATQKLNATSLTIADRLAQVKALQVKLAKQSAIAKGKLEKAEKLRWVPPLVPGYAPVGVLALAAGLVGSACTRGSWRRAALCCRCCQSSHNLCLFLIFQHVPPACHCLPAAARPAAAPSCSSGRTCSPSSPSSCGGHTTRWRS